jgi:hypothetical protein
MNQPPAKRFEVRVEEGPGHGGLYELEKTTYHHIIDTRTQEIAMTFEGEMSASLSTSNAQWEDYSYGGVSAVTITPDESAVIVKYYGGKEEIVPLPH